MPASQDPYRNPVTGDYLMVVEARAGPDGDEWRLAPAQPGDDKPWLAYRKLPR